MGNILLRNAIYMIAGGGGDASPNNWSRLPHADRPGLHGGPRAGMKGLTRPQPLLSV